MGYVIPYPDGSSLTSTALSVEDIETAFQDITIQMLGFQNLSDSDKYSKVRIGWQREGQPGPTISNDTIFIRCTPLDTDYGRMRDVVGSVVGENILNVDVFTRAWKTAWTFYGDNSLNYAAAVRSALITIQFVYDFLDGKKLYVNPSIKEPQRVPEQFQGRWWERVDLEVHFNEEVTETFTIGTAASVEVIVSDSSGIISDFPVTLP